MPRGIYARKKKINQAQQNLPVPEIKEEVKQEEAKPIEAEIPAK